MSAVSVLAEPTGDLCTIILGYSVCEEEGVDGYLASVFARMAHRNAPRGNSHEGSACHQAIAKDEAALSARPYHYCLESAKDGTLSHATSTDLSCTIPPLLYGCCC